VLAKRRVPCNVKVCSIYRLLTIQVATVHKISQLYVLRMRCVCLVSAQQTAISHFWSQLRLSLTKLSKPSTTSVKTGCLRHVVTVSHTLVWLC
jgi:hypothetical protein